MVSSVGFEDNSLRLFFNYQRIFICLKILFRKPKHNKFKCHYRLTSMPQQNMRWGKKSSDISIIFLIRNKKRKPPSSFIENMQKR